MPARLYSDDFKAEPFWWEAAPRIPADAVALPKSVDVLVIGSGYTGLSAALQTQRGGRSTLVVDAQAPGWGCSSRNGGQVSNSLKPDYHKLARRVGAQTARGVLREGFKALEFIEQFIAAEKIECDWQRSGRFVGAHNRAEFERLRAGAEQVDTETALPFDIVPPELTRSEIGTDFYHGGCVYPQPGALHPGKFSSELLRLAQAAGVQVRGQCVVSAVERHQRGYVVTSTLGHIQARDVIVASNGYTGKLFPRLRRRVIPIGSYMIATEPLPPGLMDELLPTRRMITDTRRLVHYYRACPEGRRMLFGGRTALAETDPLKSAPRLHRSMCRIFPQLEAVRISHAWMGFIAYTFDEMPHIGRSDGVYYALGYCGSGVSLSVYFGRKLGLQVLGDKRGETPLSNVSFQTRPGYTGRPWFLAPSILYYKLRDALAW